MKTKPAPAKGGIKRKRTAKQTAEFELNLEAYYENFHRNISHLLGGVQSMMNDLRFLYASYQPDKTAVERIIKLRKSKLQKP